MILSPDYQSVYSLKQLEQHRMSDDEFYAFCLMNDQLKFERDRNGNIIVMPNTGGITGIRNSEINADVVVWNRKRKLGKIFDSSTAFRLANSSVRSPDVAWISNNRWDNLTQEQQTKFPPICPDFLIELMSNSDELKEATEKMQEWIANGCQLGWLISPKTKEVRIFRANGTIDLVKGFDTLISGEDILPDFELDLNSFDWE